MHDILGQCLTDLSVSPPIAESPKQSSASEESSSRKPAPLPQRVGRVAVGPRTRPWHSPWSPLSLPHWRISTRHTTKLRYPSKTAMPKQTFARPTKAPTGRWSSIPTCKAATRTIAVAELSVATNARLALVGGGAYLKDRLAANTAAPADLADAVNSFANTIEQLGMNYLIGAGAEAQDPLRKDLDSEVTQLDKLCA